MNRCPACGAPEHKGFARAWDSEYRTTDEVFAYLQCTRCEAIFLEDPPVDRLSEIYPPTYYSLSGAAVDSFVGRVKRQMDARFFRNLLRSIPGDTLRVLDVGAGSGWMLTLLREVDRRVVETHQLELDDTARAAAEAAGHVFHQGRVEELTTELRFDCILLLSLIEHVADPGAVLRRLAGTLSDRGVVLVKTPNTDSLDCRMFRQHNWGGFHCPRHWVLFDRDNFVELARRSGLEEVWTRYTQGAPQWCASILGWMADRGLLQVSTQRPLYTHPLHAPLLVLAAAFDFFRAPFVPTSQMFVLLRKRGLPEGHDVAAR